MSQDVNKILNVVNQEWSLTQSQLVTKVGVLTEKIESQQKEIEELKKENEKLSKKEEDK